MRKSAEIMEMVKDCQLSYAKGLTGGTRRMTQKQKHFFLQVSLSTRKENRKETYRIVSINTVSLLSSLYSSCLKVIDIHRKFNDNCISILKGNSTVKVHLFQV